MLIVRLLIVYRLDCTWVCCTLQFHFFCLVGFVSTIINVLIFFSFRSRLLLVKKYVLNYFFHAIRFCFVILRAVKEKMVNQTSCMGFVALLQNYYIGRNFRKFRNFFGLSRKFVSANIF